MFKTLRSTEVKTLNHNGRSLIGETMQLEGDLRTSGSIDISTASENNPLNNLAYSSHIPELKARVYGDYPRSFTTKHCFISKVSSLDTSYFLLKIL